MDNIREQVNIFLKEIAKIENFISLCLKRENITSEVATLLINIKNVQEIMSISYQKLNDELESLEVEHDELMRRMRRQQSLILSNLLNKRKRALKEKDLDERQRPLQLPCHQIASATKQLVSSSTRHGLTDSLLKLNLKNINTTPRITITEYQESPLVKRSRPTPIPFSFLEFEVQVTPELFGKIPKYMRGRETLEQLNEFLEEVVIPCFNDKYKLFHRQRNAVRNTSDFELWKLYNEQASYVPGKYFITPGDISRKIQKMLDKKMQNRITMLRHVGFLQEKRVSQTICYVWTAHMKQ